MYTQFYSYNTLKILNNIIQFNLYCNIKISVVLNSNKMILYNDFFYIK